MKRILSILPVVSAIVLALGIQGCEADVDLNNVDTSVKVNASVAVPIGSMHASLRDFVGDGTWGLFIENKTLTFKDTFSIERKFHNLELSKYISKAEAFCQKPSALSFNNKTIQRAVFFQFNYKLFVN